MISFRSSRRSLFALIIAVALPALTTAQTVVGLPGRESREVIKDSPVYISPDFSRGPLTTLSVGTRVLVRRRSAEWTQIEFNDARWGVRTGYIRTDALSPAGAVVTAPGSDETAGLTARPPSPHPAPGPNDRFVKFSVDEAIAFGRHAPDLDVYWLQANERWTHPPRVAGYTTPFLRVALAANVAKKRSQSFAAADVTREMTTPEIHVIGLSQKVGGGTVANVTKVFVLANGGKEQSRAIQPERTVQLSEEYKNLIGFSTGERGVVAVSPLSILQEDNEVHVVYDRKILDAQGGAAYCDECAAPIKLKGIR